MGASLSVPLKEQENLKELFRILDENGLKEEKEQVLSLADYIDSMDEQFGKVLSELQDVKQQLDQMQEKGIRQSALKTVRAVESKVGEARVQLKVLKVRFVDGVNRTIKGFKEKGTLAVYQTIDFFGIRKRLQAVKMHLHRSIESADRGIDRLSGIGDEIYGVKTHLGNIKRELAGKEPLAAGSRDVETGAVFQIQKILYGTIGALNGMEKQTDQTLKRLDSLGQRAEEIRKPSVKESLRSLQGNKMADKGNKAPIKKIETKKEAMR